MPRNICKVEEQQALGLGFSPVLAFNHTIVRTNFKKRRMVYRGAFFAKHSVRNIRYSQLHKASCIEAMLVGDGAE
jgi:hypothetical protein